MNIGEMRDRITFQEKVYSLDSPYVSNTYSNYTTVWAKVEYLNGREYWNAKAVNAEQTVRFIIRYRNDITTKMRVAYNSMLYDITAVQPLDNKKQWLVVVAKEVITCG